MAAPRLSLRGMGASSAHFCQWEGASPRAEGTAAASSTLMWGNAGDGTDYERCEQAARVDQTLE